MAMKNNAKFEEELTWHFKTDIKNLKLTCLMALMIDAKFKGNVTCTFKNNMRNLANMHTLK